MLRRGNVPFSAPTLKAFLGSDDALMDASEPGGGMRFGIRDRGLLEAGATAFGALTRVTVGFVTLVAVGSTDADGGAFECGGGEAFPDSGGRGITSLPWHFGQGTVLPPNCSPTRNGAAQ